MKSAIRVLLKTKQMGFTLIELIIVIVILAILAAFAVPRFINLSSQARAAAVNGMGGGIRSAAALAHGLTIALNNTASAAVVMDGQSVTMVNYYPTGDAAGIQAAMQDTSGFTVTAGSAGTLLFQSTGATAPTSCQVSYSAAATATSAPNITVTTSNC